MAKELYEYLDTEGNKFWSEADDVEQGAGNVKSFAAADIVGELRDGRAVGVFKNAAPLVFSGPSLTPSP